MTHRGPFQPLLFCVILCDSGSYLPAKTCTALTTLATLHNHGALGNKLSSPGGQCHQPGRRCGAGSGQGIIPASQRIASPSDRPWMGSGLGEKATPENFQNPRAVLALPFLFFFVMNTPVKNKGNYIIKERVKIALRA